MTESTISVVVRWHKEPPLMSAYDRAIITVDPHDVEVYTLTLNEARQMQDKAFVTATTGTPGYPAALDDYRIASAAIDALTGNRE